MRDVRLGRWVVLVAVLQAACAGAPPHTLAGWRPPPCLEVLEAPIPRPSALAERAQVEAARAQVNGLASQVANCKAEVAEGAGGAPQAQRARAALDRRFAELLAARARLAAQLDEAEAREQAQIVEERGSIAKSTGGLIDPSQWGGNKGIETSSPPPPPPPPLPRPAEPVQVSRFPTIDAPVTTAPGETFDVQVWLAAEKFDDLTDVVQGQRGPELGSMILPLKPLPPDAKGWKVKVQLSVTGGLAVVGRNGGELELPRHGDSTPARFQVRAGAKPGPAFVYATFYEDHAFLGRVRRAVQVVAPGQEAAAPAIAAAPAAPATPAAGRGGPAERAGPTAAPRQATEVGGPAGRPPDLSVTIHVGFDPAKPRQAELLFDSPWIDVPRTVWDVPPDLAAALSRDYATFANRSARGLVRPGAAPEVSSRELLLGFGRRQWRAVPLALQVALEKLLAARGEAFTTIQIVTNEPTFPWELVALPDGQLLGTRLAVARWHLAESGGVRMRPPQRLRLDGVSMLAPAYQGERRLPAQQAEIEAVRDAVAGRLGQVRVFTPEEAAGRGGLAARLRDDGQAGAFALHFAGHGDVDPGGAGSYRLALGADGLSATEWREVAGGGRAPPFLFLNACNLAQVERVAGMADGWAPASLEAGVAGYVGGLWPIGDRAASEAARVFYDAALDGAPVAEALRRTRQRFLLSGDPTFLAYVFYGDPRLAFEVGARR